MLQPSVCSASKDINTSTQLLQLGQSLILRGIKDPQADAADLNVLVDGIVEDFLR